ncbi:hypothetical protein D3C73_1170580 [compost metagenome]
MQVEDGRRIGAAGRPPPGVQALVGGEAAWAQVQFLHTLGQAAEPAGLARLDTEYQFAFLVLQHGAAGWQADHQEGGTQPGEPATAQVRKEVGGHAVF